MACAIGLSRILREDCATKDGYNERGYPELHAESYGSDEVDICPKPEEQFDIEGAAVGLTRKL